MIKPKVAKITYSITLGLVSLCAESVPVENEWKPSSSSDSVVWAGINAFYNYEYDKAVEILTRARKDYPLHPTVHFVWAVAEWLRSEAYDGHEKSYEVLESDLAQAITVYKRMIEDFPDNPRYQLYLGASYGLRARIHLGKKEWLGVLYKGYVGFKTVNSVHKSFPEMGDAYLPIGILNFYVGSSSTVIKFFAGLLGVEGDRDVGLTQIRVASERGEYSWIEADAILAYIYLWMDENYEASLPLTSRLRNRFPGSFYYQHLYTESLIRLGQLGEAEENLRMMDGILERLPPHSKRGWIPSHNYQKALLEFYRGNLGGAFRLVDLSVREHDTELDTNLAFAYLLRGKIHDLRGERELARSDYAAARKLDNYTSAVRDAEKYLRIPYRE